MFLKFKGKTYPVSSIAEASDMWSKVRDEAMSQGLTSRDLNETPCVVDASGKTLGYISWNGRVWHGEPGSEPRIEFTEEQLDKARRGLTLISKLNRLGARGTRQEFESFLVSEFAPSIAGKVCSAEEIITFHLKKFDKERDKNSKKTVIGLSKPYQPASKKT